MKNRILSFSLALVVQLIPIPASAQPIMRDIHHWYVETRWGLFEFRESEFVGIGSRYSYVTLGPLGTFGVNPVVLIAVGLTAILVVAALAVVTLVLWRG